MGHLAPLKTWWQSWQEIVADEVGGDDLVELMQLVRVMGLAITVNDGLVLFY
ncbi:MAG: hypothetical protein NVSMB27_06570 [Ktedonobacteraceae bacterium]